MNDKILKIKKSTLADIANKVRAKTGSTDLIAIEDLDDAVAAISSGGSSYEEWNGAYEEIVSGHVLTLICDDSVINSDYFYSLDSGVTWLPFTSSNMVLSDINKIRFKTTTTTSNYIAIGTTNGEHDIQFSGPYASHIDHEITEDTTWYVFTAVDKGGSSD